MILVTIGSTHFPFPRMAAFAKKLAHYVGNEQVIFQYGNTKISNMSKNISLYKSIPYIRLLDHMRQARIIICHGGPGTVYQALSLGKIPWVLTRETRLGEHVINLSDFCRFMGKKKLVRIISDQTPISQVVKEATRTTPYRSNNTRLIAYLDNLMKS